MSVRLDAVRDARVRHGSNGIEVIRAGRVDGLSGQPDQRARDALLAPGVPRLGDRHPAFTDLVALDISLEALDPKTFDITITYRQPNANELARISPLGQVTNRQWFAVTVTEELQQDIDGEPLYHWYTGRPVTPVLIGSGIAFQSSPTLQFVWKNELARVQKPSLGIRITLVESEPIEGRLDASGTINDGFWEGYPAETWLVGGLDSIWDLDRWRNTYELFYNPETWKFRSRVEYFGAPPSDAVIGNGIADFNIYRRSNFNTLPFTLR